MKVNAFITHKKAEQFSDCQDRFSVNYDTKSIALSDGMGSTWQQKIWADILVRTFTDSDQILHNQENIKRLSIRWKNDVLSFINRLKEENAPQNIIYRNERNLNSGKSAGATFVGIRLKNNRWVGNVLGDSCLIVWDGEVAEFLTSQNTDEFDSFPDYYDSNDQCCGKGTPKSIDVEVKSDQIILMVSDPFSDFLLEHKKSGNIQNYISKLIELRDHDEFEKLVDEWRNEGMHNDDTTLIVVDQKSSGETIEKEFVDCIDDFIRVEEEEARKAKEEEEVRKVKEEEEARKAKEEEEARKAKEEEEKDVCKSNEEEDVSKTREESKVSVSCENLRTCSMEDDEKNDVKKSLNETTEKSIILQNGTRVQNNEPKTPDVFDRLNFSELLKNKMEEILENKRKEKGLLHRILSNDSEKNELLMEFHKCVEELLKDYSITLKKK